MMNRAFHSETNQSPYKIMFHIEPRIGLSTSILPSELIQNIQDENNFRKLSEDRNKDEFLDDEEVDDTNSSVMNNIQKARRTATEILEKHAKKMKAISDKSYMPVKIGDYFTKPTPDQRAKRDLKNIIGVVL